MEIDNIMKRIKGRKPLPLGIKQRYSVLIPLIRIENNWEILYELRSKDLKRQPGEISFPGGQVENGENYEEAAIREAMEELNISRDNIDLVGELDFLISNSDMIIRSFLAIISNIELCNIEPSKEEVDHIFTVPLEFFINNEPTIYHIDFKMDLNADFPYDLIPNGKDYNWRANRNSVYFYNYKGYTIWGYTAKMTKCFIDIIK